MGVDAGGAATCLYGPPDGGPPVEFVVTPGVFFPTRTSELILTSVIREFRQSYRTLDLGCGCGYAGLTLARRGTAAGPLCASDVSRAAVDCCRVNAERIGVACDARAGSLFDC